MSPAQPGISSHTIATWDTPIALVSAWLMKTFRASFAGDESYPTTLMPFCIACFNAGAIASDLGPLKNGYEALNRGDVSAALEVLHPSAEWHEHSDLPEASDYRGRGSIRAFLEGFLDSWQEFRQEPEDFLTSGDRVAIVLRLFARGKGSGICW